MARSNFSASKRQRESERDRKREEKSERRRNNQSRQGDGIPIASAEDIQGGYMRNDAEVLDSVVNSGVERERSSGIPMRLFVGGLDDRMGEADLRQIFAAFGPVDDCVVVHDRDSGASRGFGFVTMSDRRDAATAIKALEGTEHAGRSLVVRVATDRGR